MILVLVCAAVIVGVVFHDRILGVLQLAKDKVLSIFK